MAGYKPSRPLDEMALMRAIWDPRIADDPEKFVLNFFPWGKDGTPLYKYQGPRTWQRDELQKITQHIKDNREKIAKKQTPLVYNSATVSGRGPGKSALTSWLNLWFQSCVIGGTAITTANTETQLKSRTWAELGKWHSLLANSHWFERQAMSLKPADWFGKEVTKQLKIDTAYWYAQAQLWSEDNPDAFAGVHNDNGTLLIFDEASGIPIPIWDVSEGFFTEPVLHRYWFAFSNGRRNSGAFFECFHKHRRFWPNRRHIDARTVEGTDTRVFEAIIAKHGIDSDPARVEVLGQFPKHGQNQFISREAVEGAALREAEHDDGAPLMLGVDVARFGDDETVLRWRRGRNAKEIPPVVLKGLDNMEVANHVAHWIDMTNPDGVCIDSGAGAGVIDRLRERGYKVFEIGFGTKSPEPEWANNRTYLWALLRDWLPGASIDDLQELVDDLTGPEYKFQANTDKMRLETKEEMKARGLQSPNHGDALVLTFGVKVARKDSNSRNKRKARVVPGTDFAILG